MKFDFSILYPKIKEYCLLSPQEECCGLIVAHKTDQEPKKHCSFEGGKECYGTIISTANLEVIKCKNIHPNRKHHFFVDPNGYIEATLAGKVIGVYHSQLHNDKFSNLDLLNARNHKLISIMYNLETDSFAVFDPDHDTHPIFRYVGKIFEIGKNDCYSLIQEYYKNELSIELPNYERGHYWYDHNPDIFNREFDVKFSKHFKKVDSPEKNDILIFKYLPNINPHHLGVYLGNDEFLHHPKDRLSTIEAYNVAYKAKTSFIARYKYE